MRKIKPDTALCIRELHVKVYASLLFTIALIAVSACSLQSQGARKETHIAVAPKPQQEVVSLSQSFPTSFEHVQLLNRNNWLVADFNHVWRTENGGYAWTTSYGVKPDAGEGKHIGGLSFIDTKTGFLIVDRQLLRTDDSGVNWNKVAELHFGAESCYFVDAQHGWAVGSVLQEGYIDNPKVSMYVGGIFATKNGGRTWEQQRIDLPQRYFEDGTRWYLSDVFFADQMTGWAVGFGIILWTADGGEDWHVADAEKGRYKRVRFLDEQFGWATQRQSEEVSVTTDGGRRWKLLDGLPSYGSWSTTAVFVTRKQGFATLLSLYETKDGGRSWKQISGSSEISKPAYDYVGRAQDGTLVALGLNGETVASLVSPDNGATWQSNSQVSNKQSINLAKGDIPLPPSTIRKSEEELLKLALRRVRPVYPEIANAAKASDAVVVEVVVDEEGNVTSARALSGHPLLRDAAVAAARDWKFTVTKREGVSVKVVGTLTFNFKAP
jgi:TonB family protein